MFAKTTLLSGMIGAALLSMTSAAQADHFVHRHRLVNDVERLHDAVETFYHEVKIHAGFSAVASEAHHLLRTVDHFCDTAQRHGSLRHLKVDFQEVAREMRHVQSDLMRNWRARREPHILQTYAAVERAFDRVYYDLYETHCSFIQYHCTIPHHHGHSHGHHHAGHPFYNSHHVHPFPSHGKVHVNVHGHGHTPVWAQILKAALN